MTTIPFNTGYLNFKKLNSQTALQAQKDYQRLASDLSSGGRVEDYSDVQDVSLFVSSEVDITAAGKYLDGDNYNSQRMKLMSSKLSELRQIADSLQREISMTISNTWAPISNLVEVAQNARTNLEDILNSKFNDQYLFSGTTTITPAVASIDDPAVTTAGAVTNTYYIGNTQPLVFKADDITDITVDVNAGQEFAAELAYAINLCAYVSGSVGDPAVIARLGRANDLCLSASSKAVDADTSIQIQMRTLSRVQESLQLQVQSLESTVQQLGYKTPVDTLRQYVDASTSLAIAQAMVTKNDHVKNLVDKL